MYKSIVLVSYIFLYFHVFFMYRFIIDQDELGLNKEIMWRLTPEKKWQLYLSKNMVCVWDVFVSSCTIVGV
jgi:hypothetical protein